MSSAETQHPLPQHAMSTPNGNGERLMNTAQESLERLSAHAEHLDDADLVRLITRLLSVIDANLPVAAEPSVEAQMERIDIDTDRALVESVIVQWLERHGYVTTKNPALTSYLEAAMGEADRAKRRSSLRQLLGVFVQPTALAGQEEALAEAQRLVLQCQEKERESLRLTASNADAEARLRGVQAEVTRILADAQAEGDRFRKEGERAKGELIRAGEQQKTRLVAEGTKEQERLVGEATAEAVTRQQQVEASIATLKQAETALQARVAELRETKRALLEGLEISEEEYLRLMKGMHDIARTFESINDDTMDRHLAEAKTILQTFFQRLVQPINNLSEKYGEKKRAAVVKRLIADVKATIPSYRVKFSAKKAEPVFGMGLLEAMLEILASEETDTMRAEVELGNLIQPIQALNNNYVDDFSRALKELLKGVVQQEAQPKLDEEMGAIARSVEALKSIVVQSITGNTRDAAQRLARTFSTDILTVVRTVNDLHGSSARVPLVERALASFDAEFAGLRMDGQVTKIKLLQFIQQCKAWLEILQREKADVKQLQAQFSSTYLAATAALPLETLLQEGEATLTEQIRLLEAPR